MGTTLRIEAPKDWTPLEIAQAVVGPGHLVKAERVKGVARTFQDYRPMRMLAKDLELAYKAQLEKLVAEIRAYVEKHIVLGPLGKAGPSGPAPPPGPEHIHELRALVERYHQAFIAGVIGPDTLRPGDVQRLIDAGILPQDLAFTFQPGAHELPPRAMRAIEDAYRYGHVLASARSLDEKRLRGRMTYKQFVEGWAPSHPLSEREEAAITWLQHSAAASITGLGNRIAADFSTIAIEADANVRRRYAGLIGETLEENVARRDTWREAVSELGRKTGDYSRDFGRIAATEKMKAMQEGIATGLISQYGDPDDIMVAKQPNPDACPDCIRLHLTGGPGTNPRIFKLSELVENGTNVGRHRDDWLAVVGATHPWCGCELIHVPEGMGFDDQGNLEILELTRSDWLEWDLRKALPKEPAKAAHLTYGESVPEQGVTVRVGDPRVRAEIDKVIARTPPEIFDKRVGVTLITTETPRVQNPLEEHDYAYWTSNEIRLMQTLPAHRIKRVLPHELGHSLNVYLMHQMGGAGKVRQWHSALWAISVREGFVSKYAKKMPIENAAEVTMHYLYHRKHLMLHWPQQFAFVHKAYRGIWR